MVGVRYADQCLFVGLGDATQLLREIAMTGGIEAFATAIGDLLDRALLLVAVARALSDQDWGGTREHRAPERFFGSRGQA